MQTPYPHSNSSTRLIGLTMILSALGIVAGVFLIPASADEQELTKAAMVSTNDLGGKERYITHISTDKPIYRAGETVYIRAVLLNGITGVPLAEAANGFVKITGPKGDTVASGYAAAADSVIGFKWLVPDGQAGGEYTINVTYPGDGFCPAKRTLDIRAYRAPRLKTQVVFVRDGYGPGDTVAVSCNVERAEGGFPTGAPVTAIARLDGLEVFRKTTTVDAAGNCGVIFDLPKKISRGEGTMLFVIKDGGITETASKTIPILLQTVDLAIYPEGGDLVAGLPNRVYIEAKTPAKKPADIVGSIIDSKGKSVADIRTEHEGRGRTAFTPVAGESYFLKITEPSGIATRFPLPAVKTDGAVIRTTSDITKKGEPVIVEVASSRDRKLTVALYKREVEVESKTLAVKAGQPVNLEFHPPYYAEGVLRVTVWDEKDRPLAERLLFKQPAKSVHVALSINKDRPVPGDKIALTIKTTDDTGKPVGAVVGVTVTDDSVQEMIETREQAPRLPAMALLEGDVKELADAGVYLDPKNVKSPRQLDLLLGTQGWRRFAFLTWQDFLKQYGDDARRVLALRIVTRRERKWARRAMGGGHLALRGAVAKNAVMEEDEMMAMDKEVEMVPPPVPMAVEGANVGAVPDAAPQVQGKNDNKVAVNNAGIDAARLRRQRMAEALAENTKAKEKKAFFAADAAAEPRAACMACRVFAHPLREGWKPDERIDFTETLYWAAGVRTNAKTGVVTVNFALNDAVTSFKVTADAYTRDGALGTGDIKIESVKPFYIEPKLPLEVTTGDVVLVPMGIVNNTASGLVGSYTVSLGGADKGKHDFAVDGFGRGRGLLTLNIGKETGVEKVVINGSAGGYTDHVARSMNVVPSGFPVAQEFGGMLGPNKPMTFTVTVPDQTVPNSIATKVAVYPTPLANLTDALERLIRDPYGCFEQTSSTSYPLVMAQEYFRSHTGVDPNLIERSQEKLDKAYKRLTGFECKERGYEWFGQGAGHEALTAYGIMQFNEMKQFMAVDPAMLARTTDWLMNRRDGKGGFKRNPRALDSFGGAPENTTNAYIVWALLESGKTGLDKEIAVLKKTAEASGDTYVIGLTANVLYMSGDTESAAKLMEKLAAAQADDGHVTKSTATITNSRGLSQDIETTSAALLAWMREERFAGNVEKGMRFLVDSCKSGMFGSTQGTIMALKAITTYDTMRAKPKAPGSVQVYVDGAPFGGPVAFTKNTKGVIELPDFTKSLSTGKHTVQMRMTGGADMPFSLSVNLNSTLPVNSDQCRLNLNVALSNDVIAEGEGAEVMVTVANTSDAVLPTPIAIIGLPGGLEPRHDQLKELVKSGKIAAYEVIGREVVVYWRCLKKGQTVSFPISCIAQIPGSYTGPASRAYEYYAPEFKIWNAGLKVKITPRK